jgi:next to BRCA1 gene 1 protein
VFERYSDSVAAYVTLDINNPAVYKQLYRAAKAKLKLRIKATATDGDEVPTPKEEAQPEPQNHVPGAFPYSANPPSYSQLNVNIPPPPPRSNIVVPQMTTAITTDKSDKVTTIRDEVAEAVKKIIEGRDYRKSIQNLTRSSEPKKLVSESDTKETEIKSEGFSPLTLGCFPDSITMPNIGQPKVEDEKPLPNVRDVNPGPFAIYCNSCDATIPGEHYHCSVCDGGDFDLCQKCVDMGVHCAGQEHWLIKRVVRGGKVITSTTENIAPKNVVKEEEVEIKEERIEDEKTRTCNSCVEGEFPLNLFDLSSIDRCIEFPETNFVTCTSCDDYDLCVPCHVGMQHGHHPRHGFKPATSETKLGGLANALLAPGRSILHYAVCDGCDKTIYGVRHKCLNCPDWDYCSTCVKNAPFIHQGHRFVPIYEPIANPIIRLTKHVGIYCDGPLCQNKGPHTFITGDRYKCAVCNDTDFCSNCEANPANRHNKTHPLIKFKTPVRNITVTTMQERQGRDDMLYMGDEMPKMKSASTETNASQSSNAATQVQTIVDLKPTEETIKSEKTMSPSTINPPPPSYETAAELQAHFIRDTIADGTKMPQNEIFEQKWTLTNPGPIAWPKGCSVKFVGGDNMLALDPQHVSSLIDLDNAVESNSTKEEIHVGEDFDFSVKLRAPVGRGGKHISYWRLTGPTGIKFGHKLWCDVDVSTESPVAEVQADIEEADSKHLSGEATEEAKPSESQMIFPTLEHESPVSSTIVEQKAATENDIEADLTDVASLDDDDDDDDDFDGLTDDEYDILDASDEEYLAEVEKSLHIKK